MGQSLDNGTGVGRFGVGRFGVGRFTLGSLCLAVALCGACSSGDDAAASESDSNQAAGDGDSGGDGDGSAVELTYCDVQVVIEDKCLRCHSDDGDVSVPFNLVTYEEVSEQKERIASVVESGFMPLTTLELDPMVEALTDAELDLIVDWVDAGAPQGDCE